MTHFKKLTAALVATSAIIASQHAAFAIDEDIGATAEFVEAVALVNPVDMDFGTTEYTAGVGTVITLDANGGTVTGTDTTNFTYGTGTAGAIDINGTVGETVDISCETGGTLSDGTNTLALGDAEVRIDGADTACAGLGTTPVAFVLTSGTDTLNIGAAITVPAAGILAAGTYDTASAGGDPVTVRVIYQ